MKKLIYGIGLNDADYKTQPVINGKQVKCPYYVAWRNMLERCYSDKEHERRPHYIGCTVHPDWHKFSVFKAWMEQQEWQGKQLDKDIIFEGNKVYGPGTCAFVDPGTNTFLIDSAKTKGDFPVGVSWHKTNKKFRAQCRNHFTGKYKFLGNFDSAECAYQAWKSYKHELACQLADIQTDSRVADALRKRFAN